MNWKTLKSEYTFRCPWISVRKDHVQLSSGVDIPDFFVSELPDWVNIIAVTKDNLFVIHLMSEHEVRALLNDNQIPEGVMATPVWKYFANR